MTDPSAARRFSELPIAEFGFPGPLRDRLVDAILDGRKVSTTGLAVEYEIEQQPLPQPGERSVVVDSGDHLVAVIELTSALVVPLKDVDLAHVVDEGEGNTTVQSWRAGHEAFWHGEEMRASLGNPAFAVDDATPVVLQRFRLIERLD